MNAGLRWPLFTGSMTTLITVTLAITVPLVLSYIGLPIELARSSFADGPGDIQGASVLTHREHSP